MSDARPTVALAVSGHGFGHAVRMAEVARALLHRRARVVVRTDAPAWLFPYGVEMLPSPGWPLDVGVAQHDSLDLDVDETRRRWLAFADAFDDRAAGEANLLRAADATVLLGDVPPLAFAAAARAGIPGAALANFTWDWIYAAWPGFEQIVDRVRAGYRQASLLLRLPFHSTAPDAFVAFRRIEDVPLVARFARQPRAATRAALGLRDAERAVLLSFGGFDLGRLDLDGLARWPDYRFVLTSAPAGTKLPANVLCLDHSRVDYLALTAASDVVVTKPGYGIVADCLANQVPVLYTDRGPFREYSVLAEALERFGHARYVPQQDVRRGWLGPHLDALLARPGGWAPVPLDGAAVVAERTLALAE